MKYRRFTRGARARGRDIKSPAARSATSAGRFMKNSFIQMSRALALALPPGPALSLSTLSLSLSRNERKK